MAGPHPLVCAASLFAGECPQPRRGTAQAPPDPAGTWGPGSRGDAAACAVHCGHPAWPPGMVMVTQVFPGEDRFPMAIAFFFFLAGFGWTRP